MSGELRFIELLSTCEYGVHYRLFTSVFLSSYSDIKLIQTCYNKPPHGNATVFLCNYAVIGKSNNSTIKVE